MQSYSEVYKAVGDPNNKTFTKKERNWFVYLHASLVTTIPLSTCLLSLQSGNFTFKYLSKNRLKTINSFVMSLNIAQTLGVVVLLERYSKIMKN